MSKIKYNDDDVTEMVDVDMRSGINIGIEKHTGSLIAGASFVQRGTEVEFECLVMNLVVMMYIIYVMQHNYIHHNH
jgi:hypothetical protein